MEVLVTGSSGVLGRHVVRNLLGRVHAVRVLVRRAEQAADLTSAVVGSIEDPTAVADAVEGVDAVIHCASDPRRHRVVDVEGTERLVDTATRAGSPHIVYPGIVGSDIVPLKYYGSKMACEQLIADSPLPYSIVRTTQFPHLVWGILDRLSRYPVVLLPRDTRVQPIHPGDVAARLVDLVESGPGGSVPPVGGPTAYSARDLAGSHRAVTGHGKRMIEVNVPGIIGAAFRAGANLTPNRLEDGRTWNDFVAVQLDRIGG